MNALPLLQSTAFSDLFNDIIIGIFAQNYILFFLTLLFLIAILLFAYRFSGPEAIIVGNILLGGLFLSQINPIFTALFALFVLVDGFLVIIFIWKNIAQG